MSTKHKDLFRALSEEVPSHLVRYKQGRGGPKLAYVTARVVMIRLDQVVGPESWDYQWTIVETTRVDRMTHCVADGVLTLTLPDGSRIIRRDTGGAGNPDPLVARKGAISDALKRCGVQLGIARELGGDGLTEYDEADADEDDATPDPEPLKRQPRKPSMPAGVAPVADAMPSQAKGPRFTLAKANALSREATKAFDTFQTGWCMDINQRINGAIETAGLDPHDAPASLRPNVFRIANHLYGLAHAKGAVVEADTAGDRVKLAALMMDQARDRFHAHMVDYGNRLVDDVREWIAARDATPTTEEPFQ